MRLSYRLSSIISQFLCESCEHVGIENGELHFTTYYHCMKTINISVLILAIAFSIPALAQEATEDSGFMILADWKDGDRKVYRKTVDKIKVKGNDTVQNVRSSITIEVKVLKKTKSSYTLQWTTKDFTSSVASTLLNKIGNALTNTKIIFTTNENGVFQNVENWREIGQNIARVTELMKEELNEYPDVVSSLIPIAVASSSKEMIERKSAEEIRVLHTFYQVPFMSNDTVSVKVPSTIPLSETPILANVAYGVKNVDMENSRVTVWMKQWFDKDQLEKAVNGAAKVLPNKLDSAKISAQALAMRGNETLVVTTYDFQGWVTESEVTNTIVAADLAMITKSSYVLDEKKR